MVRVTINNSSTSGTFFDNIHNDNLFVNEYYFDTIDDFIKFYNSEDNDIIVPKNSKVYIEDGVYFNPSVNSELYSSLRYDYINEKNIESYRTPELDKLYNDNFNDRFKLSLSQYLAYKEFCKKHHDCKVDENGRHKFGTIGGGTSFEYSINYCSEEMFPNFSFDGIKCHACNVIDKVFQNLKEDYELSTKEKKDYESHKKYGPGMTLICFYRFMAIYNEFKSPLKVSIMGTGLGDIVSVKVKDFVFDITDNSCW